MSARSLSPLLHYVRRLPAAPESRAGGDGQLLERFARRGEAAAFEALLRRHGPMVLGVCRRLLPDAHEAEDAFQATFLLLVRKAGALRRPESLGPWLHGVARRTALRARAHGARRRALPLPAEVPAAPAADDLVWRDLRPVLDDAVAALPAKYRAAVVLCHLEGLTHAEAARRLGCPPGTVAARLSRARARLRARLTRQGGTLSAGALAAVLSRNGARAALPSGLLGETCRAAAAFRAGGTAAAGVVPTRITALSEGVLRSMLMDTRRKLLGVLLAAGAVAAGAGAFAYRSAAGEPPPPNESPSVAIGESGAPLPPPTVAVPAGEPAKPAATYRATNFRVEAPYARIAQLVGESAERHRKAEALRWLGRELPPWPEPCPLRVKIALSGSGGATSFAFDNGKVLSRDMHVEGSLEQLLSSVVPHEVTHAVIADHFKGPVPRWADEGIAVMSEDDQEMQRHDKLLRQILKTPGRAIPLRRLFSMRDYPRDVMVLWAEGYSVARFLVERKDRKTFLAFVKQGMKDGWDEAARDKYGYDSVEALEDAWLAVQRKPPDEKKTVEAPRPAPAVRGRKGRPPDEAQTIGPMPVTALAVVREKGRLWVRVPVVVYEPRTSYTLDEGGKVARPVTTYALRTRRLWQEYDAAKVEAYDTSGKPVEVKKAAELLTRETPVLVSTDGQKVDPFHLQVVKRGTLILVVPQPTPPPAAVPPAPPLAPAVPAEK